MSSVPFSFPPPPPPPPKSSDNGPTSTSNGSRTTTISGRGSFVNRGRGRGGTARAHIRGSWTGHSTESCFDYSRSDTKISHKRDYNTAFSNTARALPAVPSFNADIYSLAAPSTSSVTSSATPRLQPVKKNKILGLTPSRDEDSTSEGDVDEESTLVNSTEGLHFEYKGQTSNLRTPADIAAWILERKKRYPTEAKRIAAKAEAQAKRARWEEEKKARIEQGRQERLKRDQERKDQREQRQVKEQELSRKLSEEGAGEERLRNAAEARLYAEKLRLRALKAQEDLEAAELALLEAESISTVIMKSCIAAVGQDLPLVSRASAEHGDQHSTERNNMETGLQSEMDIAGVDSVIAGDSTSSSGSDSDSDLESESDSAPEQLTSKLEESKSAISSGQQFKHVAKPCQYFLKTGRCKFGRQCRYSHDKYGLSQRDSKAEISSTLPQRKNLWQVMVEKEQEEERKKVLQAIVFLGKSGLLENTLTTNNKSQLR